MYEYNRGQADAYKDIKAMGVPGAAHIYDRMEWTGIKTESYLKGYYHMIAIINKYTGTKQNA